MNLSIIVHVFKRIDLSYGVGRDSVYWNKHKPMTWGNKKNRYQDEGVVLFVLLCGCCCCYFVVVVGIVGVVVVDVVVVDVVLAVVVVAAVAVVLLLLLLLLLSLFVWLRRERNGGADL